MQLTFIQLSINLIIITGVINAALLQCCYVIAARRRRGGGGSGGINIVSIDNIRPENFNFNKQNYISDKQVKPARISLPFRNSITGPSPSVIDNTPRLMR